MKKDIKNSKLVKNEELASSPIGYDELAVNKKQKIKKVTNIILDIIIYIVLIFSATFAGSLVITKLTKGVPSIFGYSMINIVSGSMVDAGFNVGDSAFIKSINVEDYKVGDYIAFFDYVDPAHPGPAKIPNGEKPNPNPPKNRIVFHEIIEITIDANGDRWFRTKGTNNDNPDLNIIYQDYLIGKYVSENNAFVNFLKFITSSTGILVLIILPCSIILFKNCFELVSLAFLYRDKKKALKAEKLTKNITENPETNLKNSEINQSENIENNSENITENTMENVEENNN